MKKRDNQIVMLVIGIVSSVVTILAFIVGKAQVENLINNIFSFNIFSFIIGILATAFIIWLFSILFENKLPPAYSIAVIGFPKSGKTTLITALFGELFAQHVLNISTIPRGVKTIERINTDLAKLEVGEALGPTTDQDLFAYRTDIIRGKFFKQRYKVEIGDFPGEDSQALTEPFGEWFHEKPYFKWVMEADAFIFVVDIAQTLDEQTAKRYAAKMTQATRAAWQRLNEYHIEGDKNLRKKPVLLVFTKSDLFGITPNAVQENAILEKIRQLGFEKIPQSGKIDQEKLKTGIHYTEHLFSNLMSYLDKESNQFDYLFVSYFSYVNKTRLGINELVEKILPK